MLCRSFHVYFIVFSFSNRDSIPFTAYLMGGSDPEITVTPTSGILSPCNTRGTPFVISYKPIMYGKRHRAKLVVQVCLWL